KPLSSGRTRSRQGASARSRRTYASQRASECERRLTAAADSTPKPHASSWDPHDRALLAGLSDRLPRSSCSLIVVCPEAVLRCHRKLVVSRWTHGRSGGGRPRQLRELPRCAAACRPARHHGTRGGKAVGRLVLTRRGLESHIIELQAGSRTDFACHPAN